MQGCDVRLGTEGTPAFMAPEMLTLDPRPGCGLGSDLWACGVTLFVFVFGRLPFLTKSQHTIHRAITDEVGGVSMI